MKTKRVFECAKECQTEDRLNLVPKGTQTDSKTVSTLCTEWQNEFKAYDKYRIEQGDIWTDHKPSRILTHFIDYEHLDGVEFCLVAFETNH